jgi:16S rRNA (cytosine967-C5)-methyltransferase
MRKTNRSVRYIAIEILISWEEDHLPVDQVMENQTADTAFSDPRDRQLLTALVYGVLRWRAYLDWVVEKFSKYPLARMKNRTLQALRLGIFQLIFLDRVPASAAINETVQALKDMKQPKWLTGFVNGMLRSVAREQDNIPTPLREKNSGSLPAAVRLSHPEWLFKRWQQRYGEEDAISICRANNTMAPICLRVNTTLTTPAALLEKLSKEGLIAAPGKYSPLALRLVDYSGPITSVPGFAEGLFQVQDEAAQLVSMVLGPLQPEGTYLDGCSGLGGKTTHLAQELAAGSKLLAVEPNSGRLRKLQENLVRLRLDHRVTIVEGTLSSLLPENKEKFTGVLIDAPCSGMGVIRRHPDIRWNRSPADLSRYQEQQTGLLREAAQLVAHQGILVYATCSTEPEENEEVVKKFLAAQPHFILSHCRDVLPESAAGLVDSQGFLRIIPGREDLDGFFAARFIKMTK